MRELSVSTQTTPVELADLFNGLLPDDEVAGKPGADGAVILYVCRDSRSPLHHASSRAAIAARVAIDVVLQHVEGMPGADVLVGQVRKQLDGESAARADRLAPPLAVLARLYCTTTAAMPETAGRSPIPAPAACTNGDSDVDELALVTSEQRQALESLIDRLMQLPCPSKPPDRH
jgi:hypothetical protein